MQGWLEPAGITSMQKKRVSHGAGAGRLIRPFAENGRLGQTADGILAQRFCPHPCDDKNPPSQTAGNASPFPREPGHFLELLLGPGSGAWTVDTIFGDSLPRCEIWRCVAILAFRGCEWSLGQFWPQSMR